MKTEISEIIATFKAGELSLTEVKNRLQELNKKPATYPLSEGQKGLWILQKTFPEMTAYNLPLCFRIFDLNASLFRKACTVLVTQHPVLRAVIKEENAMPIHCISPACAVSIQEENVAGIDYQSILVLLNKTVKQPFVLEKGPLMRIYLFYVSHRETIVLMNIHHIVFDGDSVSILLDSLFDAYQALTEGREPVCRSVPASFQQFIEAEKALLQGKEGNVRLEYWKQQLCGELPRLDLTTDRPRNASQKYNQGKTFSHHLASDISKRITSFSERQGIYVSTIFLGLFHILLHKYTGQQDIIVGMPVSQRNQKNWKQIIGFLINMVPVRSKISGQEALRSILKEVQKTVVNGLAHSYPFPALVQALHNCDLANDTPVFQTAFMYQTFLETLNDNHLPITLLEEIHQEGEYEIVLEVVEHTNHFVINWKYNPDYYDEATIVRMSQHYTALIQKVIEDPEITVEACSLLSETEKRMLLVDWNDTAQEYPRDKCVHQLFAENVQKCPRSIACSCEGQSLTYQELDEQSTALAKYLQYQEVGPGSLVGIFMERSLDMLVSLFAVLKAGGAYVPLDPYYPEKRLSYILDNSQAKVVITQTAFKETIIGLMHRKKRSGDARSALSMIVLDEQWPEIMEKADMIPYVKQEVKSDDLAYVIYTSGSTGDPKGVMITHKALTNFLVSMSREPGLQKEDTMLAVTTLCFDIAGLELYLPLINGARCHICGTETARDADRLKNLIAQIKPTIMQATPATWIMLFHSGWRNKEKVTILCGGEAMPESLKEQFIRTASKAWNLFGPTETTIWSTVSRVQKDTPVTIGRPIANTQVYILDRYDNPAPVGIPGELCIAGDGLAKGYINRPDLTEEKFVPNPFTLHTRLYRTGDLARWRSDGTIEYHGRLDLQVKIRGFRIELEEIEKQIRQHPMVKECVVVVKQQEHATSLAAYVVLHQQNSTHHDISLDDLKTLLKAKLPDYMIPSFFIPLDAVPLTPNGKIDRQALISRPIVLKKEAGQEPPNASQIEKEVLELWQTVLKIDDIGKADRFMEAGGNSMTAVMLAEKITQRFHVAFPARYFYKYPTVRQIARYIDKKVSSDSSVSGKPIPPSSPSRLTVPHCKMPDSEAIVPDYYKDSIAIVGISCHFPGAKDHREFWQNLRNGKESSRFLNEKELRAAGVAENIIGNPQYVPMQLTIDGKELFDPEFFDLSRKNAAFMDPQFRLLLLHSWKAVEDAGYVPGDIADTGVFMSVSNSYYHTLLKNSGAVGESDEYLAWILSQGGTIPTMISYVLGMKGPSLFVHTNCSSSLAGLNSAFQSLALNQCRYALVGASTLFPDSTIGYIHRPGLNFSSDGHCRTFDAGADGMTGGEGVAVIMVKKTQAAIQDNDHIYALIRGICLNNDGSDKAGFYAPSVTGQSAVIEKVLTMTGIDPESISYVEAHGTGTKLGDPVEVQALTDVYRKYTAKQRYCALGSVKPNIGHLDTAAGLAGCIKVALSLMHQQISPSINYTKPNPEIDFENSPFYVSDQLKQWTTEWLPRRAALSSFGIGGTNVHAILEEYVCAKKEKIIAPIPVHNQQNVVIPLSAKNPEQLNAYGKKLLKFLEQCTDDSPDIRDIAYTLQVGRETMACRAVFIVASVDQLIVKLKEFLHKPETFSACFLQSSKSAHTQMSLLFENEEDSRELFSKWITRGELEKLADVWIKGVKVNWKLLYQKSKPRRISLPTYPFALQPCSIETKPAFVHEDREIIISPDAERSENARPLQPTETMHTVFACRTPKPLSITLPTISSSQPAAVSRNKKQQTALPAEEKVSISCDSAIPRQSKSALVTLPTKESLRHQLTESLAKVLCTQADTITSSRSFIDLGLDSIVAIEWIENLNKQYGLSLTAPVVYDYPNLLLFAGFLEKELDKAYLPAFSSVPDTAHCERGTQKSGPGGIDLEELLHELVAGLAQTLFTKPADIDLKKSFVELGLDSIVAVEWIDSINKKYHLSLIATAVYDYPNLQEFSRYVFQEIEKSRGNDFMPALEAPKPNDVNSSARLDESGYWQCVSGEQPRRRPQVPVSEINDRYEADSGRKMSELSDTGDHRQSFPLTYTPVSDPFYESLCFHSTDRQGDFERNGEISIHYLINPANNQCLREHTIYGKHVFPTDAYIELVYVALRGCFHVESLIINTMTIAHPIIGDKQDDHHVRVLFRKHDHRSLEFTVTSSKTNQLGDETVHANGVIAIPDAPFAWSPIIASVNNSECTRELDLHRDLADLFQNIETGTFYSTLEKLSVGNGKASGSIRLYHNGKGFLINPSVINGELGIIMGLGLVQLAEKYGIAHDVFLPHTINNMSIKSPLDKNVYYGYAEIITLEKDCIALYGEIVDEQYQPVCRIEKMILRRVSKNRLQRFIEGTRHSVFVPSAAEHVLKEKRAEIAVIGMSCRYPGAETVDDFWKALKAGKECIAEVPHERWAGFKDWYHPDSEHKNTSFTKRGGFLERIDTFDASFFTIAPIEAELMDPQQRIFLEEAWKAIESAGYSPFSLNNQSCGVYVGCSSGDYAQIIQRSPFAYSAHSFSGTSGAILAARISYFLNLKGPAMAIDTSCSSSLTAVHLACESLRNGENDLAIAGGICLMVTPKGLILTSQIGMQSKTGRCAPFDESADGAVFSEGCGVVLLKPLIHAQRDNDTILGIIKGSDINQDGKTNGITAPSALAQEALLSGIYEKFHIDPEQISYIETHGTATALGDPIEIKALTNAFQKYTGKKQFCALGSVKSNIGHTSFAAGVAGLIKVLLCMKYHAYVPSLHFKKENNLVTFSQTPFFVNTEYREWKAPYGKNRLAAVSSFGFSGTNAHLVIESYESQTHMHSSAKIAYSQTDCVIIPLSARNPQRLKEYARNLLHFIQEHRTSEMRGMSATHTDQHRSHHQSSLKIPEECTAGIDTASGYGEKIWLADVAYTFQIGREPMEYRLGLIVNSLKELEEKLHRFIAGSEKEEGMYLGYVQQNRDSMVENKSGSDIHKEMIASMHNKKYHRIIQLWVEGIAVDWEKLYQGHKPRRIYAPTYPFAKDRFWIDAADCSDFDHQSSLITDSVIVKEQAKPADIGTDAIYPEETKPAISLSPPSCFPQVQRGDERSTAFSGSTYHTSKVQLSVLSDQKRVDAQNDICTTHTIHKEEQPSLSARESETVLSMESLQKELTESLAKALHMKQALIDIDTQFNDLGLDSIVAVEWIRMVNKHYSLKLLATKIYDYPSIRQISQFVMNQLAQQKQTAASASLPAPSFTENQTLHSRLIHTTISQSALIQELTASLSKALHMNAVDIDADKQFNELGMDSIIAVEWIRMVNKSYSLKLLATKIYDYPTVRQIAVFVKNELNKRENCLPEAVQSQTDAVSVTDSRPDIVLHTSLKTDEQAAVTKVSAPNQMYPESLPGDIGSEQLGNPVFRKRYGCRLNYYAGSMFRAIASESLVVAMGNAGLLSIFGSAGFKAEELGNRLQHLQSRLKNSRPYGMCLLHDIDHPEHEMQLVELFINGRVPVIEVAAFTDITPALVLCRVKGLTQNNNRIVFPRRLIAKCSRLEIARLFLAPPPAAIVDELLNSGMITENEARLSRMIPLADDLAVEADSGGHTDQGNSFALIPAMIALKNAMMQEYGYAEEILVGCGGGIGTPQSAAAAFTLGADFIFTGSINQCTVESGAHETVKDLLSTLTIHDTTTAPAGDMFEIGAKVQVVKKNTLFPQRANRLYQLFEQYHCIEDVPQSILREIERHYFRKSVGQVWQEVCAYKRKYNQQQLDEASHNPRIRTKLIFQWYFFHANQVTFAGNESEKDNFQIHCGPAMGAFNEWIKGKGMDTWRSRPVVRISEMLMKGAGEYIQSYLRLRASSLPLQWAQTSPRNGNNFTPVFASGQGDDRLSEKHGEYVADEHQRRRLKAPVGMTEDKHDTTAAICNRYHSIHRKPQYKESTDIAVIGMAGQFPQSPDLQTYWRNIAERRNCVSEIPSERWNIEEYYDADANALGKTNCKWIGALDAIDRFDPLFFNISPKEAEIMDPQQRLVLQNAWHCIENAGIKPSTLSGTSCGVYIGCGNSDYCELTRNCDNQGIIGVTAAVSAILPARISYFLNLKGPCLAIDTACSSSLVAIAQACDSLVMGKSDCALAGGVLVMVGPRMHMTNSQAGMLSKDGCCYSFDQRANGFVLGEGVGILMLKRLSEAVRDGNRIHGVIKGWNINHDGKTNGLTAPSVQSQIALEKEVYERFGINPESVTLVEAQGTGSKMGDSIEVEALTESFRSYTKRTHYCALGSVKSNLGNLGYAAGVASVIKVLSALQKKMLPPSINFETLNENILLEMETSPFYINTELKPWEPQNGYPRRACVSSFGYNGTNAHMVFEEYSSDKYKENRNNTAVPASLLIVLSAKNKKRLHDYAQNLHTFICKDHAFRSNASLTDLAYTLQVGREEMQERLALVVQGYEELEEKLSDFCKEKDDFHEGFQGYVKKHQEPLNLSLSERELQESIDTWIQTDTLDEIAKLWVHGLLFDWHRLYTHYRPRVIDAPLYPFAKERYWAPLPKHTKTLVSESQNGPHGAPVETDSGFSVCKTNEMSDISDSIQQVLKETITDLLKVRFEDLDPDSRFSEYGFDSVSFTDFANQLNQKLNLELTPTLFFEYPTIRSCARYLATEYHRETAIKQCVLPPEHMTLHRTEKDTDGSKPCNIPSAIQTVKLSASDSDPVVIVGMSGTFPMARNCDEFWDNLENGRDCIETVPEDRWNWSALHDEAQKTANKNMIKWGGFIQGIDEFDPGFFGISPQEAVLMDPNQRLLMTYAWLALEDAGYSAASLSGSNTGVFVAISTSGYDRLVEKAKNGGNDFSSTGLIPSIGPNRLSYWLNLRGPSEPIETSCSSSLVAVHRAVSSIQKGECDQAIVGGINTILTPHTYSSFSKAGMLSHHGRCKPFSKDADGYVRSEGIGMLYLKKRSDAEKDKDHIYGIIRGSGVNHSGRSNSLTAMNPKGQADLLCKVYTNAGIDPYSIDYIETHGTGTPLGDSIEIVALKTAFKTLAPEPAKASEQEIRCGLGSVKSNIGHTELASGMAGIIKVLLQLQHQKLVKSLHCDTINPFINVKKSPFYIVRQSREWNVMYDSNGKRLPRRAGVSSFGFGGVNAHVILEEYCINDAERCSESANVNTSRPAIIVLSARNPEQLHDYALNLLAFVRKQGDTKKNTATSVSPDKLKQDGSCVHLADLAFTLQAGREPLEERLALIAHSMKELEEKLHGFIDGQNDVKDLYRGCVSKSKDQVTIFATDEGLQKAVNNWIMKGEFRKLLDLWVKGLTVDWSLLHKHGTCRRISAPTYPFARERYWVEQQNIQTEIKKDYMQEITAKENSSALTPQTPVTICANSPKRSKQTQQSVSEGKETFAEKVTARIKAAHPAAQSQIFYKESGQAFIPVLGTTSERDSRKDTLWKDKGVYLVTGGIQGDGLTLAREIVQNTKNARLMLTGHSDPGETKQTVLEELQRMGATVTYKTADVSDRQSVEAVVRETQEHYGSLDGIVHDSGIVVLL